MFANPSVKCPYEGCDKKFLTAELRKDHVAEEHTHYKLYFCPHVNCSQTFYDGLKFAAHLKEH